MRLAHSEEFSIVYTLLLNLSVHMCMHTRLCSSFMAVDEVLGWGNMRREVVSLCIQSKTLIVTFSPIKGLKWKPDVE